ncbi:MAG TPA: hypothetical protein VGI80_06495, partial [Pyrinomonadaceae bacterium]
MRGVLFILVALLLTSTAYAQTPQAVENDLVAYLDNMAKYGSYGNAYDDKKLSDNAARLREVLTKNGTRREILNYPFPKLADKMYIVTSPDKRFRIYSWDLEDGGTMHDFEYVVQYAGKSGSVGAWSPDPGEGGGGFYT